MNYNNRTFHLDPNTDNGGGGAPAADVPTDGGGAPASTPSFDPGAFKNELIGSLRQEIGSTFSRFRSELEPRLTPAQARQEDKAPSMKDYLDDNGQMDQDRFEKFMDARLKHSLKSERTGWEQEFQTQQQRLQSESKVREAQRAHISRESEYEKTNPTYRQDLLAAGDMEVNPAVGQRILGSKYSANIIHYLAKNRNDFQQFQNLSYDDPAAALEFLGELSVRFKGAEKQSSTPPPKGTKGAFGGVGSRPVTRATKDIVEEWRS